MNDDKVLASPRRRKAIWYLGTHGPTLILGTNIVFSAQRGDWLGALVYAVGIIAMFVVLRQLRSHFRMGYSAGYYDRIRDEHRDPADRRPIGHAPEPWEVMYAPVPPIPRDGLDVQD